ncbi:MULTISPECIES: TlpA disulfide reductase family protein [Shouchella]|uniref:TlpA disulfide reductase family protein n=1 Tax=Shouchella hunanensis TaxID=766894 RepID=A0ABY7W567_9BACI|nr:MULTISPECIES: TlpA disulfide reductase family protein [Shouchella]WDF04024.1 TlpA disulfide reductase family protein [Shouchella hunanensis]GAF23446.1 thiol:disulfide interchange protein [Bacillus sp. JCM 19047]
MKQGKWLGVLWLIGLLLVTSTAEAREEGPHMNQVLAPFSGSTLNGKTIHYEIGAYDKTVIHFFATWCYPCQEEMPAIVSLSEQLNQQPKSQFIPINLTSSENSVKALTPFLQQYEATFDPLLDNDGSLQKGFQIFGIPTTIVINADGTIIQRINGPINKEEFLSISEQS